MMHTAASTRNGLFMGCSLSSNRVRCWVPCRIGQVHRAIISSAISVAQNSTRTQGNSPKGDEKRWLLKYVEGRCANASIAVFFSLTLNLDSGILESLRGVAPGVCVCQGPQRQSFVVGVMRTHPDQLVDAPDGDRLEQAIGSWTQIRLIEVQLGQSPSRASSRSSHPNRSVWKWVEVRPVRFWHGQMRWLRKSFLFGFDFVASHRLPEDDWPGRHLRTGF